MLNDFRNDTFEAIEFGISTNPVLQSFQLVVNEYAIPLELVHAFFDSMEMDLSSINYNDELYKKYIYGSAEVVGLMCLKVFCKKDNDLYEKLKEPAKSLGAAFQKVNFLRDYNEDLNNLGRMYFPDVDFKQFSSEDKLRVEMDIQEDFKNALAGIMQLPIGAKSGVLLAYQYYLSLFNKIKSVPVKQLQQIRIRIPNCYKLVLLFKILITKKIYQQKQILMRA